MSVSQAQVCTQGTWGAAYPRTQLELSKADEGEGAAPTDVTVPQVAGSES